MCLIQHCPCCFTVATRFFAVYLGGRSFGARKLCRTCAKQLQSVYHDHMDTPAMLIPWETPLRYGVPVLPKER